MTKTEACWDRTEGCCMTDAFKRKLRPKRKWGDAPARIFFGGDDAREEWTWECLLRDHEPKARTFNDVPTFADAVAALDAHRRWHHMDERTADKEMKRQIRAARHDLRALKDMVTSERSRA